MTDEQNNEQQAEQPQPFRRPGQVGLKEYLSGQEKAAKKKPFKLPQAVKMILLAPFFMIFCFGILYIPFMIYNIATSPQADELVEEKTQKSAIRK